MIGFGLIFLPYVDATDATSEKKNRPTLQWLWSVQVPRLWRKHTKARWQSQFIAAILMSITHRIHVWYIYGIFTYITGWFLGKMLVNIRYMEHMGHIPSLFTNKDVDNPALIELLPTRHVRQKNTADLKMRSPEISNFHPLPCGYLMDSSSGRWMNMAYL